VASGRPAALSPPAKPRPCSRPKENATNQGLRQHRRSPQNTYWAEAVSRISRYAGRASWAHVAGTGRQDRQKHAGTEKGGAPLADASLLVRKRTEHLNEHGLLMGGQLSRCRMHRSGLASVATACRPLSMSGNPTYQPLEPNRDKFGRAMLSLNHKYCSRNPHLATRHLGAEVKGRAWLPLQATRDALDE
jgi:hypothetical protein